MNLLCGRARTQYLQPLTSHELGARFELARAVERGLLPSNYFSEEPRPDLKAYADTYLQQEIVAEGATRNAPTFSRVLKGATLCNGTTVNFTNLVSDAQVPRTTVSDYFEILKDTLVLHELSAWRKIGQAQTARFLEILLLRRGSRRRLAAPLFRARTPEFGQALETPSSFRNCLRIATTALAIRSPTGAPPAASRSIS